MSDVQGIINKIDHGFDLYNPFYEHNYRVVINLIKNDFTKTIALENRDFIKSFRRYSSLTKAPVDFIMHIVKHALLYEKMRGSIESVKRSLGNEYTVAWCYDPKTEICIIYTSVYTDGKDWDDHVKLKYGLLLQWKGFKLGKVEKVEIGTGNRTSLYDADSVFTSDTMKYSILSVSPKLSNHVQSVGFGQSIKSLILDELCTLDNWKPAADFLKRHTRDYQGVDSMFVEALLKERGESRNYINSEDVTKVSKSIISTLDLIISKCDGKFTSEKEFIRSKNLNFAIIYGASNSLYYTFKSPALDRYFFLEVNDTKKLVALHMGNPVESLAELERIKITDIVSLRKEIDG